MHRNQFVGKSRLDVFTANDDVCHAASFELHTLVSLMRDSVYTTSPLAQLIKSDDFGSTMKAGTRDKPRYPASIAPCPSNFQIRRTS